MISVIVPIYNVEKYLDRCVQSIVSQTYKNLEIILVDDGSPDNCPAICDKWAKKDNRIKVIHKENGGVSSAKNAGIGISCGEYFAFVDADDYIAPEMYGKMIARALLENADVCGCNFETVDESGASGDNLPCYCSGVFKGSEVLPSYFSEESFLPSSVNKLYKREIAEKYGIRFDESLQIGEDFMFNYCFFKHSSCVCSMSDKLYYYFCSRSGSASNSLSKKWLLRWKNTKFVLEQEKGNEQVHMLCSRMYAKELLLCYKEMNEYKIAREMKDLYLQLVSEMKENAQQFINNPLLGKSDKLKYRLFVISPVLLNLMRAINKIRTIPKR